MKIFQMMLVGTMTLLTRSVDVVRLAIGDGKPLRALAISINMNISINVTFHIGISNGNAASLSSLKINFSFAPNVRVNIIFSISIFNYLSLNTDFGILLDNAQCAHYMIYYYCVAVSNVNATGRYLPRGRKVKTHREKFVQGQA